ncbi:hypothetical protein BU15DRAFT_57290 [Melanogaster broomeanus]|nr:hypothetical protein BU15DRAFT_57290 [Melanogaster broomeanus]
MTSSKSQPPVLSNTLRDFALLRVSNVDVSPLLPAETSTRAAIERPELSRSAGSSHESVDEARAALKVYNNEKLQKSSPKCRRCRDNLTSERTVLRSVNFK